MKKYIIAISLVFLFCGCSSSEDIENAYNQGYEAGYNTMLEEFENSLEDADSETNESEITKENSIEINDNTVYDDKTTKFNELVESKGLPTIFDVNLSLSNENNKSENYIYTAQWQENTIGNSYIFRTSFYYINIYNENNKHYLFVDTTFGPLIAELNSEQYNLILNSSESQEFAIGIKINDIQPIHYNFYADGYSNADSEFHALIDTETKLNLFNVSCLFVELL